MKVRVTSIAWAEVSELVRSVGVAIERALTAPFLDVSFGGDIDQLSIIIVSISSDVDENTKVCKGYDKVSRDRHPFSGELIKSIGFAVPIDPDILITMTSRDLIEMICTTVIEKLTRASSSSAERLRLRPICAALEEGDRGLSLGIELLGRDEEQVHGVMQRCPAS